MSEGKANRFRFRAWLPKVGRDSDDEFEMVGADALAFEEYGPLCDQLGAISDVLMQSTGMLDSEGVEVFESDICTLNYGIPPTNFVFKVVDIPGGLGFEGHGGSPAEGSMADLCDLMYDITVKGNVWENPTMLEDN